MSSPAKESPETIGEVLPPPSLPPIDLDEIPLIASKPAAVIALENRSSLIVEEDEGDQERPQYEDESISQVEQLRLLEAQNRALQARAVMQMQRLPAFEPPVAQETPVVRKESHFIIEEDSHPLERPSHNEEL